MGNIVKGSVAEGMMIRPLQGAILEDIEKDTVMQWIRRMNGDDVRNKQMTTNDDSNNRLMHSL